MQILTDAFSYCSLPLHSTPPGDNNQASNAIENTPCSYLENVPGDFFKAAMPYLSIRTIVTLASTNKNLAARLQSSFPPLFLALSETIAIRTSLIPTACFSNAISCIQSHPCQISQITLFKNLILQASSRSLFPKSYAPAGEHALLTEFNTAISTIEQQIRMPPQSLSEALSLLNILVIRFITSNQKVTRSAIRDLLDVSNQAFWPEMLASVSRIPALQTLSYEISIKFCDYRKKVSDDIAGIVAVNLFFDRSWVLSSPDTMFFDKYEMGEITRKQLEKSFGVMSQAQWSAIDRHMASFIHRALPARPGAKFDDLCQMWRVDDVAFVIQAEEATRAAAPNFDFGKRAMVGTTRHFKCPPRNGT